MRWLRRMVRRWLEGPMPEAVGGRGGAEHMTLHMLSSSDNPATHVVTPIRNGFLVSTRSYNPNGPDKVDAVYAASADELGPLLVAEMAARRLTK
jgi:hypothetical protein